MMQTIWSNLYAGANDDTIKNLYNKNGCYVFKRKMHDSGKYYAYLKANGQSASKETLTYPAFPKYLLPPNAIIEEIEKSPKLTLKEGFRKENWEEIVGNFVCNLDDIEVKSKKCLTSEEKLLKYLANNNSKDPDLYIYSIFVINLINETTIYCAHLLDITKKHNGSYSKKSSQYSSQLLPYITKFKNGLINSEFGHKPI